MELFIYNFNIFNVNYPRFPKNLIFGDIKIFSLGIVRILLTTDRMLGTSANGVLLHCCVTFVSFPSYLVLIKL